ncbi:hypothetical protein Q9Q94_02845 [Uliginosibacterium sp. 31-16]|uniref:hypothetical protein n=1 Tax=Uliginosibacterium sp. 31-16 TaxID=3068315 RepID=UPI00273F1A94|nr:hypothetical protein [Uliginosibacterium sp. 31-16]MDP5238447.1 hypothetical protein [Uliginosibacterium sp. 31-16]
MNENSLAETLFNPSYASSCLMPKHQISQSMQRMLYKMIPAGLDRSGWLLLAILALFLAIISAVAYPLNWVENRVDLEIAATGQTNPQSRGAQVWIPVFGSHSASADAKELIDGAHYDSSWGAESSVLRHLVGPAKLQWSGRVGPGFVIEFVRHPWSGIVDVSVNGRVRRLDLYSEQNASLRLTLQDFAGVQTERVQPDLVARNLAIIAGLTMLYMTLGLVLVRWMCHRSVTHPSILRRMSALLAQSVQRTFYKMIPAGLDRTSWHRLAILALFLAVISAVAYPLNWMENRVNLEIAATGQANPQSRGVQVWITVFGAHSTRFDSRELIDGAHFDSSWGTENSVLRHLDGAAKLQWTGDVGPGFVIEFVRHSWSGIVDVSVNGRVRRLDLYSEQKGALRLTLQDFSGVQAERVWLPLAARNLAIIAGLTMLYMALGSVLVGSMRRRFVARPPLSRRMYALLALPSVIAYGISHLAFWPAQMTSDSDGTWQEATTGGFRDLMSAFHSGLAWISVQLWNSPASLIVIQYLLLTALLMLVIRELDISGVPRWAIYALAVFFPVCPANFVMATTYLKDPFYTIGIILIVVAFVRLLRADDVRLPRDVSILLAMGLLVTGLARHNGMLVAPALAGMAVAFFWRRPQVRGLASIALGSTVVLLFIKLVMYPALGISGIPERYRAIVPMHVLGAYAAAGAQFNEKDAAVMLSVLPLENWRSAYYCPSVVPLFWHKQINWAALSKNASEVMDITWRQIQHDPQIAIDHELCVTSMLWRIQFKNQPLVTAPLSIYSDEFVQRLKIDRFPLIPSLHDRTKALALKTMEYPWSMAFWNSAIYLYLTLFMVGCLAVARRDRRWWLLATPSVFNTLSLAPLIGAPDFRYQYAVVVIPLLLLPLMLAPAPSPATPGPCEGDTA